MLQVESSQWTAPRARASRTQSAYETDWRSFERWCCAQQLVALPASTQTLAQYLVHLVERGRKVSTIRRARIAIGLCHHEHGFPRPDLHEQIRVLERRFIQNDSAGEKGAAPLCIPELERMMHALGNSLRDERDRALLLLGFAGGFRSCELVALNTYDIVRTSTGLRVHTTDIRAARQAVLCPVAAIDRWLSRLSGAQGALFRSVCGSRVTSERLAPRAVSRAVQRAAARAQLTAEYSADSLRSARRR